VNRLFCCVCLNNFESYLVPHFQNMVLLCPTNVFLINQASNVKVWLLWWPPLFSSPTDNGRENARLANSGYTNLFAVHPDLETNHLDLACAFIMTRATKPRAATEQRLHMRPNCAPSSVIGEPAWPLCHYAARSPHAAKLSVMRGEAKRGTRRSGKQKTGGSSHKYLSGPSFGICRATRSGAQSCWDELSSLAVARGA